MKKQGRHLEVRGFVFWSRLALSMWPWTVHWNTHQSNEIFLNVKFLHNSVNRWKFSLRGNLFRDVFISNYKTAQSSSSLSIWFTFSYSSEDLWSVLLFILFAAILNGWPPLYTMSQYFLFYIFISSPFLDKAYWNSQCPKMFLFSECVGIEIKNKSMDETLVTFRILGINIIHIYTQLKYMLFIRLSIFCQDNHRNVF